MKFERIASGDFIIEGILIKRNIFLLLEPNYSEPEDIISLRYDNTLGSACRTIITKTKQYKIFGIWLDGERYFRRIYDLKKVSFEEEFEEEISSFLPKNTNYYRKMRRKEYPPISDLIVALWEKIVVKTPNIDSEIEKIENFRKEIKSKYSLENKKNAISQDETETN